MTSLAESLVKYSVPELVSTSLNTQKGAKGKKGKQALPPPTKALKRENEDYLNSILPPREYTEGG